MKDVSIEKMNGLLAPLSVLYLSVSVISVFLSFFLPSSLFPPSISYLLFSSLFPFLLSHTEKNSSAISHVFVSVTVIFPVTSSKSKEPTKQKQSFYYFLSQNKTSKWILSTSRRCRQSNQWVHVPFYYHLILTNIM